MKRRRIRGTRLASGGEQGTLLLGGNLTGGREGKAGWHLRQGRQGIREGGLRYRLVLSLSAGNRRRLQLDDAPRGCAGTGGTAPGRRKARQAEPPTPNRLRLPEAALEKPWRCMAPRWLRTAVERVCLCGPERAAFSDRAEYRRRGVWQERFPGPAQPATDPRREGREPRKRRKSLRRRQFFDLLRQRAGR